MKFSQKKKMIKNFDDIREKNRYPVPIRKLIVTFLYLLLTFAFGAFAHNSPYFYSCLKAGGLGFLMALFFAIKKKRIASCELEEAFAELGSFQPSFALCDSWESSRHLANLMPLHWINGIFIFFLTACTTALSAQYSSGADLAFIIIAFIICFIAIFHLFRNDIGNLYRVLAFFALLLSNPIFAIPNDGFLILLAWLYILVILSRPSEKDSREKDYSIAHSTIFQNDINQNSIFQNLLPNNIIYDNSISSNILSHIFLLSIAISAMINCKFYDPLVLSFWPIASFVFAHFLIKSRLFHDKTMLLSLFFTQSTLIAFLWLSELVLRYFLFGINSLNIRIFVGPIQSIGVAPLLAMALPFFIFIPQKKRFVTIISLVMALISWILILQSLGRGIICASATGLFLGILLSLFPESKEENILLIKKVSFIKTNKSFLLKIAVIMILALGLFTTRSRLLSSLNACEHGVNLRFIMWRASFYAILDKPFFGHGLGIRGQYIEKYLEKAGLSPANFSGDAMIHPHNLFLHLGESIGIPALFIFSLIILAPIRYFLNWLKKLRKSKLDNQNNYRHFPNKPQGAQIGKLEIKDKKCLDLAFFTSFIIIFIASFFDSFLFIRGYLPLIFAIFLYFMEKTRACHLPISANTRNNTNIIPSSFKGILSSQLGHIFLVLLFFTALIPIFTDAIIEWTDYELSTDRINLLHKINPWNPRIKALMAKRFMREKNYSHAKGMLENLIAFADYPHYQALYAAFLAMPNNEEGGTAPYIQAAEILEKTALRTLDKRALYFLRAGRLYKEGKNPLKTRQMLEKALEIDPQLASSGFLKKPPFSQLVLNILEDFQDPILWSNFGYTKIAVELIEKNDKKESSWDIALKYGRILRNEGKRIEALSILEKYAYRPEIMEFMGLIYLELQDLVKASNCFKKAIKASHTAVWNGYLATSYYNLAKIQNGDDADSDQGTLKMARALWFTQELSLSLKILAQNPVGSGGCHYFARRILLYLLKHSREISLSETDFLEYSLNPAEYRQRIGQRTEYYGNALELLKYYCQD